MIFYMFQCHTFLKGRILRYTLLCILCSNSSCAWKLKGWEATFNSDLKEGVKLEQEENMWKEVGPFQVEVQSGRNTMSHVTGS